VCVAVSGGFIEVALALDHGIIPVVPLDSLSVVIYEGGVANLSLPLDLSASAAHRWQQGGGTVGIILFYYVNLPPNELPTVPFSMALVYSSQSGVITTTQVLQYVSYGQAHTATNGPAQGLTPVDTGLTSLLQADVMQFSHTSVGLTGIGDRYSDFTWVIFHGNEYSRGSLNHGQQLGHVQHAFHDPSQTIPQPNPAPSPPTPGPVSPPPPSQSIVVVNPPSSHINPPPAPTITPVPGPIPQSTPGPAPQIPGPAPQPTPIFEPSAPPIGPSVTCGTAPAQPGYRRVRKDRVRIGTFNLGGLFDGVDDETGTWMGGTSCPGYHPGLNLCNAAGATAHAARLQHVFLRLNVDILHVNEVEDCKILQDFADEFRGYRSYMPNEVNDSYSGIGFVTDLTPSAAGVLTRLDPIMSLASSRGTTHFPVRQCQTPGANVKPLTQTNVQCAEIASPSRCGDMRSGDTHAQHYKTGMANHVLKCIKTYECDYGARTLTWAGGVFACS
jgi:hypothetical protein